MAEVTAKQLLDASDRVEARAKDKTEEGIDARIDAHLEGVGTNIAEIEEFFGGAGIPVDEQPVLAAGIAYGIVLGLEVSAEK